MQKKQELNHFGIDYGSKLAGTTAICFLQNGKLKIIQSEKKKDADAFIMAVIKKYAPGKIFFDAPLSLPLVYRNASHTDFFYRKCDREVNAMSPMFLGGLTARAMKLKHLNSSIPFYESYPKALVNQWQIEKQYKKDISAFIQALTLPFALHEIPASWHQVDALLAWLIGYRYSTGNVKSVGLEQEGVIYY